MNTIENEIAAVKVAAQKKLRRLRERERKDQLALDLRVVSLLKGKSPAAYEAFCIEARAGLQAEAALRSARARRSPLTLAEGLRPVAPVDRRADAATSAHSVVGAR